MSKSSLTTNKKKTTNFVSLTTGDYPLPDCPDILLNSGHRQESLTTSARSVKGAPPILLPYHQVWLRFPRGLPNDQQEHFRLLPPCPTYLLSLRSTPRSVHSPYRPVLCQSISPSRRFRGGGATGVASRQWASETDTRAGRASVCNGRRRGGVTS
jgi:hypothetical protein